VGWKRARKICEKHWRRSENNCWERDGTSAVIAVPSLTALSTTASRQSARRIADPSRSDTRNVGFGFSAEQSTTNPPDLALRPRPTGARLSTPFQPCVQADVRHAAASIPRAPSHQTRQISGGEPAASVTSVGIAVERPLLSRRRQGARALLDRKPRCAEFSAPAHQLQPDIRIRIGSPVVPVAPDRLAVGRLAGPEWPRAGAAFSRWPVVIAGASTPGGDIRGLSGRPRRCCNCECCDRQHDHDSHHRLRNAGRSRLTAICLQPVYSVRAPACMKLITLCSGRSALVCPAGKRDRRAVVRANANADTPRRGATDGRRSVSVAQYRVGPGPQPSLPGRLGFPVPIGNLALESLIKTFVCHLGQVFMRRDLPCRTTC
jgi:hypothetical protein